MAPDKTIATCSTKGRKSQKNGFTFLACCNADGSHNLPLYFIGTAKKPRCFKKKSANELGLHYANNKKAWMTGSMFGEWLKFFNQIILEKRGQKVLSLMDNCSAHGSIHSLPTLSHVEFYFLPPNTTAKLQPLDAGIIASVKMRYRQRHLDRAVDLADVVVNDTYKIGILSAMRWLSSEWADVTKETIVNFWKTTGILSEGLLLPAVEDREALDSIGTMQEELDTLVAAVVPIHRRISIGDLHICEEGGDCTAVTSDE